jgi:hypothetical protein
MRGGCRGGGGGGEGTEKKEEEEGEETDKEPIGRLNLRDPAFSTSNRISESTRSAVALP